MNTPTPWTFGYALHELLYGIVRTVLLYCAVLLAIAGLSLCSSCMCERIQTPLWTMWRVEFIRHAELPKITFGTNGVPQTIEGYKTGTDGEALGTAVGAAVKALAK